MIHLHKNYYKKFVRVLSIVVTLLPSVIVIPQIDAKDCKVRFYGDTTMLDESCSGQSTIDTSCEAVTWVTVCQNLSECGAGTHYKGINASGIPAELYIDVDDNGTLDLISKATSGVDSAGRYRFTFKNVPCYTETTYKNRKSSLVFNLEAMNGHNPMFTRVDTGLDDSKQNPFYDWFIKNGRQGKVYTDRYNGTWFRVKTDQVKVAIENKLAIMQPGQTSCQGSDREFQELTGFSRSAFLSQTDVKLVFGNELQELLVQGDALVPKREADKVALLSNTSGKIRFTLSDKWRWALSPSDTNKKLERSVETPIVRDGSKFVLGGDLCLFAYRNSVTLVDENNNALPFAFSNQRYLFEAESKAPFKIEPILSQNTYYVNTELPQYYSAQPVKLSILPSKAHISGYHDWQGYVKVSEQGAGLKIWALTETEPSTYSAHPKIKILKNRDENLPAVRFSAAESSATEADVDHELKLTLEKAYDLPLKVDVKIVGAGQTGVAVAGTDYRTFGTNGILRVTFSPGETAKFVIVKLRNDNEADGEKKLQFALVNPEYARIGLVSTHTITISDSYVAPAVTEYNAYFQVCEYTGSGTEGRNCIPVSGVKKENFDIPELTGSQYDLNYDLTQNKYRLTVQKVVFENITSPLTKRFTITGKTGFYSSEGRIIMRLNGNTLVVDFFPDKSAEKLWRPQPDVAWSDKVFLEPEHTRQGETYHSPQREFLLRILPLDDSQLMSFPQDVSKVAELRDKDGQKISLTKGADIGTYKIKFSGYTADAFKTKYGDPDKPAEIELVFKEGTEDAKKWMKWQGKFYIDINDSIQLLEGQRPGSQVATIGVPSLFFREVLFRPVAWYGSTVPIELAPNELQVTPAVNDGKVKALWTNTGNGIYKLSVSATTGPAVASSELTGDAVQQVVNLKFTKGSEKEYQLRLTANAARFVEKRDGSYFEIPEGEPPQLLLEGVDLCRFEGYRETDECRRRVAISKIMGGLSERESLPSSATLEGVLVFENNWALEKLGEKYSEKLSTRYLVRTSDGEEVPANIKTLPGDEGTMRWVLELDLSANGVSTEVLESLADDKFHIEISDGEYTVSVNPQENRFQ